MLVKMVNKLNRYLYPTVTYKFDDTLAGRCRCILKYMCNAMHQNHYSQSPPSKRNAYQPTLLMCQGSTPFRMPEDQR